MVCLRSLVFLGGVFSGDELSEDSLLSDLLSDSDTTVGVVDQNKCIIMQKTYISDMDSGFI